MTTTDVEPSHTSAMEESVSIDDATVSRLPMETDDLSQGDNQSRPEEPAQSRSHAPSGSRSPKPTNSGDNQSMESPVIPVILDNPKVRNRYYLFLPENNKSYFLSVFHIYAQYNGVSISKAYISNNMLISSVKIVDVSNDHLVRGEGILLYFDWTILKLCHDYF